MEYIMKMEGQMILETGGKTYFLEQYDAICFDASVPHSYKKIRDEVAKAALLVHYR